MKPSGEKSDISGDKNSTAIQSSGGLKPKLSNNCPKCTLIERFDKTVRVIAPSSDVRDFPDLENADKYIKEKGYEVNVNHIQHYRVVSHFSGTRGENHFNHFGRGTSG